MGVLHFSGDSGRIIAIFFYHVQFLFAYLQIGLDICPVDGKIFFA